MASNAPAQTKPTRVSLSYEEISKFFSLPIAEAGYILGVCTSVLKRICRSHGIVRWPYRKLVSGKDGDDSKNSEREKAKELLELSKAAKQKPFSSSAQSAMSSSTSQAAAQSHQAVSKAGGQVLPPELEYPDLQNISETKPSAKCTKLYPKLTGHGTWMRRAGIKKMEKEEMQQGGTTRLAEGQKTWCVAKPSASNEILALNLDYACSQVSCAVIQKGGPCYNPDNLVSHAAVSMNLYYAFHGRNAWNCYFNSSALVVRSDPSYGSCTYY